jgi:PIN domain nuclease of toxin-antitoxin system
VSAVIDASALLALLFAESGAETVADAIAAGGTVGAVNLAEVATVLVGQDKDAETILAPVRRQIVVEPFLAADAITVAGLYPSTANRGLSLGDRACLALAQRLGAPALTAEHVWADLELDVEVRLIRERPLD